VGAWRHLGGDLIDMPLHGLGVAARQHESGTDTALGTNGPEDIGRLCALVMRCSGPASPFCPAARDLVFLADPRFILPPKLYWRAGREPGPDRFQLGGETFLKASMASSFCALWRGRAESLQNPRAFSSRLTVLSSSDTRNSS